MTKYMLDSRTNVKVSLKKDVLFYPDKAAATEIFIFHCRYKLILCHSLPASRYF